MLYRIRIAAIAAGIATAVVLTAGCGGDGKNRLPTVAARGKLMYKDPKKGAVPAAGALVVFNPIAADEKNLYYPQGTVGEDGTFTLTTYENGDGAPAGEYGVTVLWKSATKSVGGEDRGQGQDILGRRYADPKNFRIKQTVSAGGPNDFAMTVE